MNVRKPTDYSALFAALNTLMAAKLSQMELYARLAAWSAASWRRARRWRLRNT